MAGLRAVGVDEARGEGGGGGGGLGTHWKPLNQGQQGRPGVGIMAEE